MTTDWLDKINTCEVPTPCYVVNTEALEDNLRTLAGVRKKTGCEIILALKGFSMFSVFPLIRRYLHGVTASSLNEARLGFEEFKGEVHVYAPAYRDDEFDEIMRYADHITFNSLSQWELFRDRVAGFEDGRIKCALRINPEHSEVATPLYDPCAKFSRLGITAAKLGNSLPDGISGLHFHTLCELNSDALNRTIQAVEEKFAGLFSGIKWLNFGGGHHITRSDYDINLLCDIINRIKNRYNVDIYLEPGEAVALNAGVLVASVLDITENEMPIAVLDTSAAAHMPDVLEMPYRPGILNAGAPGEFKYTYRLGGLTCLAGDVIGDYSFREPLKRGSKLVFLDMAHYTMVKNTTFNGVGLPSIVLFESQSGNLRIIRKFGYEDYRNRLS